MPGCTEGGDWGQVKFSGPCLFCTEILWLYVFYVLKEWRTFSLGVQAFEAWLYTFMSHKSH